MISAFYGIFLLLLQLSLVVTDVKFVKPSFNPYCHIRENCRTICSCSISQNCSLLKMNEALRDSITFHHNQVRQIQTYGEPQASGMTMIQYDMDLEEISECLSSKCLNEHSSCFITPRFTETSQTTFQLLTGEKNLTSNFFWLEILNFWLGNIKSMSVDILKVMPAGEKGEKLHNYAQILSDKILFVGCSWSRNIESIIFVCSYGPRGTVSGESIYKGGNLCTECPPGYGCDHKRPFQNLCKEGVGSPVTVPLLPPPSPPPKATPTVTNPPRPPSQPLSSLPPIRLTPPPRPPQPIPYRKGVDTSCRRMTDFHLKPTQKEYIRETFRKTPPLLDFIESIEEDTIPFDGIPQNRAALAQFDKSLDIKKKTNPQSLAPLRNLQPSFQMNRQQYDSATHQGQLMNILRTSIPHNEMQSRIKQYRDMTFKLQNQPLLYSSSTMKNEQHSPNIYLKQYDSYQDPFKDHISMNNPPYKSQFQETPTNVPLLSPEIYLPPKKSPSHKKQSQLTMRPPQLRSIFHLLPN